MGCKKYGCFSWVMEMKRSLNERWTRFRGRNKIDIQNDVTYFQHLLARAEEKDLLSQFVNKVINDAKCDIEAHVTNTAVDNISMSSSLISQIAEAVVTESLVSLTGDDTNTTRDDGQQTTVSD